VADDFDFAQLGQQAGRGAMRSAEQGGGIDGGHVERRHFVSALAGRGFLEDQRLVLRLVGADFAEWSCVRWFRMLRHFSLLIQFLRSNAQFDAL
jgi:hypothetical protein